MNRIDVEHEAVVHKFVALVAAGAVHDGRVGVLDHPEVSDARFVVDMSECVKDRFDSLGDMAGE